MKEILGYFDILGGEVNYSKLHSCMRIENDPLITRPKAFLGWIGRCPLVACLGASFVSTAILLFVACAAFTTDTTLIPRRKTDGLIQPHQAIWVDLTNVRARLRWKNSPAIYVAHSRFTAQRLVVDSPDVQFP